MQYPLIIGNWKLNGSRQMVNNLVTNLSKKLINISGCTVVIAPPNIYLGLTEHIIKGSYIILGAQNVDVNLSGPFTGETSAEMLKDIGVKYVIIGHSERRFYHQESDDFIAKKFAVLKEQGLIPVLCVGETEAENKAGKTKEICARQIDAVLKVYGATAFKDAVIAYEPIWAIGSGKSAIPKQVQVVHKFIRNYIAEANATVAEHVIIQYGGSVNTSNVKELFTQQDVDGVLVGSASLNADTFMAIVKAAGTAKKQYSSKKYIR